MRGTRGARSVDRMNGIFDSIRRLDVRRGPRRLVGGIAGGIAQRTGLDVWLVRLLVLASFLLPVLGPGAYLVAWLLTPWQDDRIPLERVLAGRG